MNLNFWPFNCTERRRRKEVDQNRAEVLAALRVAFAKEEGIKAGVRKPDTAPVSEAQLFSPGPTSCSDCGGLFVADKLKPITFLTIFFSPQPTAVTERFFCQKCLPTSNLVIELLDKRNCNLDTAYFSTQEHWLQPFDFQGEEQTLIKADDFGLLYCGDCNNLINTKRKCQKCSTPKRRR